MSERYTINDLLAAARSRIDRLEPAQALRESLDGALLIDTRSEDLRLRDGQIPGSIPIPLSVLYWRLDPASGHSDPRVSDPARRVILICAHGYSSSIAAATLRDLGFPRATDVEGGFERWQSEGLPVTPVDQPLAEARTMVRLPGR
jgi:rhodanese-related sulfurtransferase